MKEFLQKIANAGISEDSSFALRNKLRVFNNAILLIFCITFFYFVISFLFDLYLTAAVICFSFVSNILVLLLVRRGHYKTAFHYAMWYGFIFLSAFSLLFGRVNNSYSYFLFMPVACNILFDSRRITLFYLVLSIIFLIGNVHFVNNYEPYYAFASWMYILSYPNIIFAAILIFMGVRLFKKENVQYATRIEEQREVLAEKNTEITDSINYAKRIQSALIPSEKNFSRLFPESFVLFQPKDIVSGDFYWLAEKDGLIFYATADCTGHGVPGGFMTMLGISFLDELVNEKKLRQPAAILDQLRERIIQVMKQSSPGETKMQDGMDIVLCCYEKSTHRLQYAAANNPLYLLRENEFTEFPSDKQPCGFYHGMKPFTNHEIQLQPGDSVFTATDGFADQFGGPQGKKFKYKPFRERLLQQRQLPMQEQKEALLATFHQWKGALEQVDDVLVIGVRIR